MVALHLALVLASTAFHAPIGVVHPHALRVATAGSGMPDVEMVATKMRKRDKVKQAFKGVVVKVKGVFGKKEEWPMLAGRPTPHRMRGTLPKPPPREIWVDPAIIAAKQEAAEVACAAELYKMSAAEAVKYLSDPATQNALMAEGVTNCRIVAALAVVKSAAN